MSSMLSRTSDGIAYRVGITTGMLYTSLACAAFCFLCTKNATSQEASRRHASHAFKFRIPRSAKNMTPSFMLSCAARKIVGL